MSLAELFYCREAIRTRVKRWHSKRQPSRQQFTLEALEPRLLLSATPTEIVVNQALEPAAITVPSGSLPSLDVDLNGQADALSDGIVIIRHLFGFTGNALTDGAVDPAGQRTDPIAIQNYLNSIGGALDVDLNQQADALSDGIMIIRSLFGFSGNALTDGAIDLGGQRTDPAVIATFLDNMNPQRELIAPILTAGLQQDTGLSSTDTVTFNPAITGTMADINQIATFTAGFDSTPVSSFVDVTGDLLPTGAFSLSATRLAEVAGGTLVDGAHTLHLRATDARGNLTTLDRTFTLDTLAPVSPTFDLAITSDTGVLGDQETTAGIVTLKGLTDATTPIQLVGPGTSTLSNGIGTFQLPDLTLAVGDNAFTFRASDVAGNTSDFNRVITRLAATQQADVVLTWNQVLLEAIRLDATPPPMASRGMAMVSLAMYDTINAIEGTPGYYVSLPTQPGTSADAAAASAAHRVLSYLYPGQQALFDTQLAASLATVPDGASKTNGITLGQSIADAIIAIRSQDGWDDFVDYVPGNQPGDWQLTGPMFDVALLPQWADLTPFALTSPNQFTPAGPPTLDSAGYAAAFNEVKALGSATGSTRTADQTEIARFWADGSGTYTPPGHWNQIASQIALEQGNSLSANARLFAQLNVALADAGITAWDAKYQYEFWRPITAIQQADLDGNAATTKDATWASFLITPPFPEYTSGHSTFSGAAAEILTSLFGGNVAFTTTSLGLPNVQRSFTSFEQAAQEAGKSRIYGGIHFEFSNQDGLASGKSLAQYVVNRFTVTTDTQAPTILLDHVSGTVTDTNLTMTGRVLDNLSGVAALQATLDNGAFAPVTFQSNGSFSLPTTLALNGTADGLHTLTFEAMDNTGNIGTVVFSFTLDTLAPAVTLTSPVDDAVLTAATRLRGTADATGSMLVELCYAFDNGTLVPVNFAHTTGGFDAPLDLSILAAGSHTLSLRAQDAAGHVTTITRNVSLAAPIPLTITAVTPQPGSSDVGSTFRPQVFFSRPVNPTTLNANNFFATDSAGIKLAATIVPSQDGTFAWLFFTDPMPGGSTMTLHVDGTTILAAGDGQALDANLDGTPGGIWTSIFSTVSLVPLQGTTLSGKVLDPGPDLKMMTFDDIRAGADGVLHTSDDVFLNPIANAKVFIIGLESQAVFTDAQGNFSFSAVPSGNIKLVIDGHTATNAPAGLFFPEMVMDLQIEVGQANTVMGTMGAREGREANLARPEVYLPRLRTEILQTVSDTQTTMIGASAQAAPNLTDQQRQFLTLEVQPGSLIGLDGQPLANGQVGISTVPPELVRDMLPPGLLQHTFDITIQAPDTATFNTPLEMTFPNVFNAAPGTKLNFLSFDHTTGRLVIEGTATVSADGLSVTTDPGTGITKAGWHGVTPPGSEQNYFFGNGGPGTGPDGEPDGGSGGGPGGEPGGGPGGGPGNGSNGAPPDGDRDGDGDVDKYADPPSPADPDEDRYEVGLSVVVTVPKESLFIEPFFKLALPDPLPNFDYEFKFSYPPEMDLSWTFDLGSIQFSVPHLLSYTLPENAQYELFNVRGDLAASGSVGAEILLRFDSNLNAARFTTQLGFDLDASLTTTISGGIIEWLPEEAKNFISQPRTFDVPIPPIAGIKIPPQVINLPFSIPASLKNQSFNIGATAGINLGASLSISPTVFLRHLPSTTVNSLETFSLLSEPEGVALPDIHDLTSAFQLDESIADYSASRGFGSDPRAFYRYQFANGGELTGRSDVNGHINAFLPDEQAFNLIVYRPSTNAWEIISGTTGRSGSNASETARLSQIGGKDSDADGIPDIGELVIGTFSTQADSDSDGILDSAEIAQGSDPLGGLAFPSGVVGALELQGEAKGIVVEGSSASNEARTAYIATGSYGMAIVDASQVRAPIVLGQLDLPGDAIDVSVDPSLRIAAVASGAGGLHLVNVAAQASPALLRTIAVNASQVEVFEGIVYVTTGSEVQAYDLLTGEKVAALAGTSTLTGLAREGRMLYTMETNRTLRAIDISSGALAGRGTLVMPIAGNKLFVGNGIAYVAAGNGGTGGFMTANVANPNSLQLLSGVDNNGLAGTAVALNGSGLAVVAGSSNFVIGGFRSVDVLNISDPTDTGDFITRFTLPQVPFDIAIGAGMAFIADGTGDLQIVNCLPFDNQQVAPTVTALLDAEDLDPAAPGIQMLEQSFVRLNPAVTDDVQVRNVELLRDGQVVRNDVGFPFELSAVLPSIAANGSNQVTLQVRATDTGGNFGLSAPIAVQLVPDTFGPTLVSSNVNEGGIFGRSFRSVTLTFSEAIDPATLTTTAVQLVDANGIAKSADNIQFRTAGKQVQLTFAEQPVGAYTLRIDRTQVKDRVGNAMGVGFLDTHFTINQFSVEWIAPTGGNWNTAANWSTGIVPIATDDVFIGVTSTPVVISSGTVNIQSLISNSALTLSGGTLAINGDSQINGAFVQTGGILGGAGNIILNGSATITGGSMQDAGTTLLNGATTISGSGFTMEGGRVLTNSNTVTWTAGIINLNSNTQVGAGTINNLVGATWVDSGTVTKTMRSAFGTTADNALGLFHNAGTYTKSGTGTSAIGVNVTDTGVFTVSGGTLDFFAFTNTHSAASTITVGVGATLNNSNSTQVLTGGTVTVDGTLSMNDSFAVLNLAAAQTLNGTGTLVLANGTLSGTPTLTVNLTTSITFVVMQDAGTTLLNGATTISGSGFTMEGGRVLTNSNTVTWTAGIINLNSNTQVGAGTINNLVGATWVDSGTVAKTMRSAFGTTADNALALFHNAGTYTKSGTGTTSIGTNVLDTGVLTITGGTLEFFALTNTHSAASTITVEAGATLNNSNSTQVLTGGTVTVNGTLSMNDTFAVLSLAAAQVLNGTGTLLLANGTLTGTPTLTVNLTTAITFVNMLDAGTTLLNGATTIGGSGLVLDGGRVLTNSNTVTWTAGTIELNNNVQAGAGTINNLVGATWVDSGTVAKTMRSAFGTTADNALALFNNAGTYTKSGTGTTSIGANLSDTNVLTVTGGTLNFSAFTNTHSAGSTITVGVGATLNNSGSTQVLTGGTVTVAGTLSMNNSFAELAIAAAQAINGPGTLALANGTLTGTPTLTVNLTTAITFVNMLDAGTTLLNGATTIGGSGLVLDGGRVLTNSNTVTWTAGTIELNSSGQTGAGTINNLVGATWVDSGTVAKTMRSAFGTAGDNALALFHNAGTYTKSGTGTTFIGTNFLDTNVLTVSGGTLDFFALTNTHSAASTITVGAGATLNNSNSTQVLTGGTVTVNGTLSMNDTFGVLSLAAAQVLNGTGTLVLANGTLTGTPTLTVNLTTSITGGDMRDAGTTLLNGATTISGSGLVLDGGRVLTNNSTVTWTAGTIELNNNVQAGAGTINNLVGATWLDSGTVAKTMRSAFGTVGDNALALFHNAGTYTKSGTGTTTVSAPVLQTGTVLVEAGTMQLSITGGFANGGNLSIKPGALVSVTGNYSQAASGSFSLDIGGTATTQFGRMTVTGSATLNGTLNVALANGFTPALGDRFRFMTDASRTGFFTTTNGLDLGGGLAFQVEQTDPLDLELVTVAAAPASATAQSSGSNPDSALTSDGSLAYVQRSWVKSFVAETGGATGEEDEELLIALPTGV